MDKVQGGGEPEYRNGNVGTPIDNDATSGKVVITAKQQVTEVLLTSSSHRYTCITDTATPRTPRHRSQIAMYRPTMLSAASRRLRTSRQLRSISTTRWLLADSPQSSQGHATRKVNDPMHKDADIQSSAAKSGMENKNDARSSTGTAGNQPHDAARQGNTGGESKDAEGTGSFKDQIGGQPGEGKAGEKGGKEKTGADTLMGKFKDALGGSNVRSSSALGS